MGQSSHRPETVGTQNQNNAMSDDPRDGGRKAFKPGKDGVTPAEQAPPNDRQDQSTIEAFAEAGAGVAPKE